MKRLRKSNVAILITSVVVLLLTGCEKQKLSKPAVMDFENSHLFELEYDELGLKMELQPEVEN